MKKVLMLASVASMIDQFNMDNIAILQKMGYEVHVATNFEFGSTTTSERIKRFKLELDEKGIKYFHIDFPRGATSVFLAYRAYEKIKELIDSNKYSIVHCHSPIGGVIGRLACKKYRKDGLKVIYTAHGFHFYKGSPKKNWIFYPVEKALSACTDLILTINKEDYSLASKKMKSKATKYIPGVGVDTQKYSECQIDRLEKRETLNMPEDGIVLLSVGELVKRKNHETIIKAISKIKSTNIYYFICGRGKLEQELRGLITSLNLEKRIFLLGFRDDVPEICKAADIYVFPSTREGLGLAGIEGMAAGLPIVSTHINGIKDYTEDAKTGYCLDSYDIDGFAAAISKLAKNSQLRMEMGMYNQQVSKKFDIANVNELMKEIYVSM